MCTFILGTLPAKAPLERLRREFIGFSSVGAGDAASLLEAGELFGRLTTRHCDCGTPLARGDATDRGAERIEHKVERLRRKGWSKSRIDRWLAQVEGERERHEIERGTANDVQSWLDWLRYCIDDLHLSHVGLLVDDFSGLLDGAWSADEKPIPAVRAVRLPEVSEQFLIALNKGTLYRFRK